jgi:hypothetical protein
LTDADRRLFKDCLTRPIKIAVSTVVLEARSLIGALALQLCAALGSERGHYRCSECDMPFTISSDAKALRTDREVYCDTCKSDPKTMKGIKRRRERRRYRVKHPELRRQSRLSSDPLDSLGHLGTGVHAPTKVAIASLEEPYRPHSIRGHQ